ncbi:MAG: SURF1 family protein [Dermatophilaceae bacterium]
MRTIVNPRSLGLLVLAVFLAIVMVLLGRWQLGVARDDGLREAIEQAEQRPVEDLAAVLGPHTAFPADGSGRRLRAVGHFDAARQVLVADRRLGGRDGWWVLVPLVVDSTGARLAVVRGFVATPGAAPTPPPGPLTLVGSLAPSESARTARAPLGPGQVASVDVPALLNVWDGEVYNGFVFAMAETPDPGDVAAAGAAASGRGMERVPPPQPAGGLSWRNAAYAVQWWVFAAFVLWMWWKMVREETRRSTTPAAAEAPSHDPSDAGAPP